MRFGCRLSVSFYECDSYSGGSRGYRFVPKLATIWREKEIRFSVSPLCHVMMCRLNKKETLLIVLNMNSGIWLTSFKGNRPKGTSFPLPSPLLSVPAFSSPFIKIFFSSLSNFTLSELAALVRLHYLMYSAFSSSPSPDEARLNWALALKSVELSTCS